MKLLYYKSEMGNFGDDLNAVIWRQLLPPDVFEDDDAILMGIGSIFNAEQAPPAKTEGKRIFVLGAGAGYGPLPRGWEKWSILAVRGPLTAGLIGRPELAATDAAALVALLPSVVALAPERSLTLFVPHHHSMNHGKWQRVARSAGLTFVDPRWKISDVMSCFSKAKLVVTEAMHGAILADALRIPWIPVTTSPDILPFKWRDWTLSLRLSYKPQLLPASSFWELHHHHFLTREARARGLTAPGLIKEVGSPEYLMQDFLHRYREAASVSKTLLNEPAPASPIETAITQPSKGWHSIKQASGAILDPLFIEHAAKHLSEVTRGPVFLSEDVIFADRLEQLQQAAYELIKAIRD